MKQAAGGSYEGDLLEVELPDGYDGPMNYAAFRDCVEAYYRGMVGQGGRAFNLGPGSQVRMRNNRLAIRQECAFEAD